MNSGGQGGKGRVERRGHFSLQKGRTSRQSVVRHFAKTHSLQPSFATPEQDSSSPRPVAAQPSTSVFWRCWRFDKMSLWQAPRLRVAARTMHESFTALPQASALTVLSFLARLDVLHDYACRVLRRAWSPGRFRYFARKPAHSPGWSEGNFAPHLEFLK